MNLYMIMVNCKYSSNYCNFSEFVKEYMFLILLIMEALNIISNFAQQFFILQ